MTDTDAEYRDRLNAYLDAERALFETRAGSAEITDGHRRDQAYPSNYAELLATYQAAKKAFAKAAEAAGQPIPHGFLADTE